MGNAAANGVPAPNSSSTLLRLRRGKKSAGCPCFLAEHAPTWETLALHDKFRSYVLRHLLDEGFICSVLEHGEREHALAACAGVQYYEVGYRFKLCAVQMLSDMVRMFDVTAALLTSDVSSASNLLRALARDCCHHACETLL